MGFRAVGSIMIQNSGFNCDSEPGVNSDSEAERVRGLRRTVGQFIFGTNASTMAYWDLGTQPGLHAKQLRLAGF